MLGRRSARTRSGGSGITQAVLVTFLFFTAAIGAIGYLLYLTSERENAAVVESEKHLAETAIKRLQDEMANRLIDYSWWDELALQFDDQVDVDWADENIGSYLQEQFGYSGTYVLSPDLENIYVSTANDELPADALVFLDDDAGPFLAEIKETGADNEYVVKAIHLYNGVAYIMVGSLVRYEETTEYENAMMPRPIMIFIREINDALLAEISNQFLLTDIRLSMGKVGDASIDLMEIGSKQELWLSWQPKRPGDAILNDLFPKIAAVAVALAVLALMVFLMWAKSVSAANEAKAQFLAKMSHELRTPLNPIIGFAEVIMSQLRGPVPDAYRDYAGDIHRSAKHLQGIIGDVLDFSKVESGELVLRETTLDIEDLILRLPVITSSTWDANLSTGEQTRLPLRYEIEKDLPLVRADELRVRQVMINLLSNAAKFSNGAEVVIRAYHAKDGLWIEVEDSGIGISKLDIDRVFSPFVQAEASGKQPKNAAGTGLGLSVSRELMLLHGGALDLKSMAGAGTTAFVRFPAERLI